jgi:hypothetical protein
LGHLKIALFSVFEQTTLLCLENREENIVIKAMKKALVVTMNLCKSKTEIAQSFSPFSSRDGRQVCRPDPTRATNLFSKI